MPQTVIIDADLQPIKTCSLLASNSSVAYDSKSIVSLLRFTANRQTTLKPLRIYITAMSFRYHLTSNLANTVQCEDKHPRKSRCNVIYVTLMLESFCLKVICSRYKDIYFKVVKAFSPVLAK